MEARPSKRRPGRPPKIGPAVEVTHIDVRVPAALRRAALHAAVDADLTIGEWVRRAIKEKLERERQGD